jgi:predicted NAD-dependent protein-ADP-ribosyltransferase YbiA (DUF1768 family)
MYFDDSDTDGVFGFLSPFSNYPITDTTNLDDKKVYKSVYHFYLCQKFLASSDIITNILNSTDVRSLTNLSNSRRHPLSRNWDTIKYGVMKKGFTLRFEQYPLLVSRLLELNIIINDINDINDIKELKDLKYNNPLFSYWGVSGLNMMSVLVSELYDILNPYTDKKLESDLGDGLILDGLFVDELIVDGEDDEFADGLVENELLPDNDELQQYYAEIIKETSAIDELFRELPDIEDSPQTQTTTVDEPDILLDDNILIDNTDISMLSTITSEISLTVVDGEVAGEVAEKGFSDEPPEIVVKKKQLILDLNNEPQPLPDDMEDSDITDKVYIIHIPLNHYTSECLKTVPYDIINKIVIHLKKLEPSYDIVINDSVGDYINIIKSMLLKKY